jgi:hypothetical protein
MALKKIPENQKIGRWQMNSVYDFFVEDKELYQLALACFEKAIRIATNESWFLTHTTSLLFQELQRLNRMETIDGVKIDEDKLLATLIDMKPGFHDDLHG